MQFNDNQKRVIKHGQGPLLVEAGPGSGKTTVIVERIKHLINEGVQPETFLVITFTRKAADNLKTKLKQSIPKEDVSKMQISTIHSFCLEFLKTKDIFLNLLDDDTSEKKALFIQKFKDKLGFKDENTLLDYQISSVINKFGEYASFNVNSGELIKHLEDTRPISDDYINFIKSLDFFSKKRVDDADFKDDWYNARYIQIAKAYPIYLKLLDQQGYVDYDTLQLKTLKELKDDPQTQYTTVFVDEFQDTDPLQFRIFKILEENSNYFTAVGDVDQHIYAFRSSFADYFDEMAKITTPEIISLDTNYRSTENIVNITDNFIKHQRGEYSQKHLKSNNNEYNNPNFIIKNNNNEDEASKIFKTIKYLKEIGKIKDYSDIAVLYRKHSNKTISNLINLFEENNIDFSIRGQADLKDQNEVKSIITLLWYITRKTTLGHIPTNDELDELNLKAFCGEYFEPTFWSLEDETKMYLQNLQDSYYESILEIENEYRKTLKKRAVKSYKNVKKNEDLDTLMEIFKNIKTPTVDLDKITNQKDKLFFEKLNSLREEIMSEEPPTILKIYYDLLSMSDYFTDLKKYNIQAQNLAQLTQTIHNYESFISNTDVRGLFYFLNSTIKNYSSAYNQSSGVQLMTVHAAKGLEFPVVFVTSLQKDKFPMAIKDPAHEKNYIFGSETFYTPNEFLKYKNITLDEENEMDTEEEERIIYVAMTRAADLLIVSCVGETPSVINNIKDDLDELKLDDLGDIIIKKHFSEDDDEKLKLNYSSYSTYKLCPFMYNLIYNLRFRVSDENVAHMGTVFHEIMEAINLKLKDNHKISEVELADITDDVYGSMFDISKTPDEYAELKQAVKDYFNNYSLNYDVIDSELPFELERKNYILNGAIDLVYRINDEEIGILDYKNAECEKFKINNYKEQLFTYASALREMPEFKDLKIKEACIHFVKSDYTHKEVINDEIINNQLERLNDKAIKIINEEFPKRHSGFCEMCKFRVICNE